SFVGHLARRNLAQFTVEQGEQFFGGFGITAVNRIQDLRDFVWLCHSRLARRWSVPRSYRRKRATQKMFSAPTFRERLESASKVCWRHAGQWLNRNSAPLTSAQSNCCVAADG